MFRFLRNLFASAFPGKVPRALPAPRKFDYLATFEERFNRLGIRHFKASEFLTLGGSHYNPNASAFGLNTRPPVALWSNLFALAKAVDAIREEFGSPIVLTSVYRSEAYNSKLSGASPRSQHRLAKAADMIPKNGNVHALHRAATRVRARGVYTGGIGKYRSFVHADIRGTRADWP